MHKGPSRIGRFDKTKICPRVYFAGIGIENQLKGKYFSRAGDASNLQYRRKLKK